MKKYQNGGKTATPFKNESERLKYVGQAKKADGKAMKDAGKAMKKTGQDQFLKVAQGVQERLEGSAKRYPKSKPTLSTKLLQEKVDRAAEIKKERATKKYQDGGRTMREKAAVRKDEKGKGMYVPVDGYRKTKGLYVGYNKAGRKEVKETGGTEVYNLKPTKRVMQDGGMTGAEMKAKGMAMKAKGTAMKAAGSAQKAKGAAMKADALNKRVALRSAYTPGVRVGNQSVDSEGRMIGNLKKGGTTSRKKK
tara:strand:+ start:374 stop:1123 length:750 start_codon:yes stop_codon:yes gene_type:complete